MVIGLGNGGLKGKREETEEEKKNCRVSGQSMDLSD